MVSVAEGNLQYQHETVQGISEHGDLRVASTEQNRTGVVQVRVQGSSPANLWANVSTLIAAFTQPLYAITWSIGGQADFWDRCRPAEFTLLKDTYDKFELLTTQAQYTFNVSYSPVSTTGV